VFSIAIDAICASCDEQRLVVVRERAGRGARQT
jgi:hypothetical protein